uniref:Saccharopine dehydrogenase (NAD(+), L-glutamate-forming) n=1 Tax=Helicotheca tamesis TaxID=374047 RepID=A0A7S2IIT5_9STRA|mmetsp:Transcript_9888/g.13809  ORF Transcript_9888/g.13809 Transcript_9888/m.13809 type:complete len:1061 (+) Transcript_9888:130-3312(+)|eukprot:CAMPEP_0185726268 /NCGR_PEP_ID=MMETSP1171-20130828/2300_1 /TAXON_ID=374046 /ORGANISM="Helicotheca tamensis, Strain CCMP826" /LENGTH=1060 /DNA_ID=CAMNT_0028394585 /DNA_START=78 /DNA_END=3260 /DNA_ORIENTATION=+
MFYSKLFATRARGAVARRIVNSRSVNLGVRSFGTFSSTSPLREAEKKGLTLGILRETYDKWECRAPLTPAHVQELLQGDDPLSGVIVQPASHRVFSDAEYEASGAKISEDLSDSDLILGVKRVKDEEKDLIPDKMYMFFSHVIKGQPENMALMQSILDKNIQLIDYECISKGKKRLVAFGKYAGIAGMTNAFQALGRRLLAAGYSTPFLNCPPTSMHRDLDGVKAGISKLGENISENGLPPGLAPLIFCFTGKGNVAKGAKEIFELLPHKMITSDQLEEVSKMKGPHKCVYGLQLHLDDIVRKKKHSADDANSVIDSDHYKQNPTEYEGIFHSKIAPYCNVLINGMYWDERFPRLLTKEHMADLYKNENKNLYVLADITCDVGGSVEFLEYATSIDNPYFMYDPIRRETSDIITTDGVAVMGVDILPTEVPRESSQHFGDALTPLLKEMVRRKASAQAKTFEEFAQDLPYELINACISYKGSFTPTFSYIESFVKRAHRSEAHLTDPHVLVSLKGHLFDSGLINQALDIFESHDIDFTIQQCIVGRKKNELSDKSSVLLRISAKDMKLLEDVTSKVSSLADLISTADATMQCFYDENELREETIEVSDEDTEQHILVLGAGRVAASLSEYLGRSNHRVIAVASAIEDEAVSVANQAKRGHPIVLDVANDKSRLEELVKNADVVVSLLPAPMHPGIAEHCISKNTNLVTASYANDEMFSLQNRCEESGIAILNEMGLDPGMDHMSAMKIIDDIKSRGGEIKSFSSVCGGLPAPEAANNHLMYKFSWSPMGVLTASQNSAVYREDGNAIKINGDDLLASSRPFDYWPSFNLECLPNRDCLPYGDRYGIQNAESIFRGTLRYYGFSSLLNVFRNMGLLDKIDTGGSTWGSTLHKLQKMKGDFKDSKSFLVACSGGDEALAMRAATCLKSLGITTESTVSKPSSIVGSFCDVLEEKLKFEEHERDMVLMHHGIEAAFEDGSCETHHSSLQVFGDSKMTAMCKTVGYTAAVGTDLLLSGKINQKGVLLPTNRDIYEPCLKALEQEGLEFHEEVLVDRDETQEFVF